MNPQYPPPITAARTEMFTGGVGTKNHSVLRSCNTYSKLNSCVPRFEGGSREKKKRAGSILLLCTHGESADGMGASYTARGSQRSPTYLHKKLKAHPPMHTKNLKARAEDRLIGQPPYPHRNRYLHAPCTRSLPGGQQKQGPRGGPTSKTSRAGKIPQPTDLQLVKNVWRP